ncbi:MAG: hypothetical protein HY066_05100 [Betaproteobacteria bacterium]|nr:hypothetical protein [Betaproteobacteria bacterium]
MRKQYFMALALAGIAMAAIPASAADDRGKTEHSVQPQTGIESWQFTDKADGVGVLLMQISPDQARAFFLARGFQRKDVDYYASSCVFMTLVKNQSAQPVEYRLGDWRYTRRDGVARPLKLKDDWLKEWKARGVSQSARIAFEWSQHPVEQTLEPGDWNQGMTTYLVPHGEQFDLSVKWKTGSNIHAGTIREIRCAK